MTDVFWPMGVGVAKKKSQGRFRYEGTFPGETKYGDPLVIMRKSDFQSMAREGTALILQAKVQMPKEFYESDKKGARFFPDYMVGPSQTRLYLNRYFHSFDFDKKIWVSYSSLDEAISEGEI